jgi:3-hydroxybutyryl-CoA dehydratase
VSAAGAVSARFEIDAELVRAWAELSGDHNRLHIDPEFAATTRYGRCIAHGPILASMVGELLAEHAGAARSAVSYRFVAPVYVPSTVTASITPGPGGAEVECQDQDGTTVLTARASWTGGTP